MNISKIKHIALGLALSATILGAKAQKVYTEGSVIYNINAMGQDVESTSYFKGDTSTFAYHMGPATVKMMGTASVDFFAVLVDVPVASIKKAAVSTPGELEEATAKDPAYTFTATADTKKIGDYNCKKYIAKDSQSGTTYDLWTTTDITLPPNIITRLFKGVSGTPVQFSYVQRGTTQVFTIKSISDAKVPAGTFSIPGDYEKISMTDLQAMGGGRKQ